MTAQNLFVFPEGVALASDTATYTPEGALIGFASKAYVNEAKRWGALFTGSASGTAYLAKLLAAAPEMSLDVFAGLAPRLLREYRAKAFPQIGTDCDLTIVFAGWSGEADAWRGAQISSDPGKQDVVPIGGVTQPLFEIGSEVRGVAQHELEAAFARLGVVQAVSRLMQSQRRSGVYPDSKQSGLIGGVGELVIITAKGVRRETTNRWLDAIGDDAETVRARARREPAADLLSEAPRRLRAERRRKARAA